MKIGNFVQVELFFKPASFGRQGLTIEGTITAITDTEITIDNRHVVPLNSELANVSILPNVKSFRFS